MPALKLKVPQSAIEDGKIAYGKIAMMVERDGTIDVPRWMVPRLLEKGCTLVDVEDEAIDVRQELATTTETHELSLYLNVHGLQDHYFERNTHYHSARLRELAAKGCPNCGHIETFEGIEPVAKVTTHPDGSRTAEQPKKTYSLHADVADHLDSLHQQFHKRGTGRIVVLTDDEKRAKALELFDAAAKQP